MNIEGQIILMKQYLLLKFERKDWHGVADAAMDLRELEVEQKITNLSKVTIPLDSGIKPEDVRL